MPDPPAPGRRILIVDDDDALCRAIELYVRARGYDVVTARCLKEAAQHLSPPPDWILLDLMLPDGDGTSFLAMLRAKNIPSKVVIISGNTNRLRLGEVHELRPHAMMEKPVSLSSIVDTFDAEERK